MMNEKNSSPVNHADKIFVGGNSIKRSNPYKSSIDVVRLRKLTTQVLRKGLSGKFMKRLPSAGIERKPDATEDYPFICGYSEPRRNNANGR